MEAVFTRIVIEVEQGASPISGQVSVGDDAPRRFTGWTGLFAALRAVTGEQPVR